MDHLLPSQVTDHRARGLLEIAWSDGLVGQLPHPLLRERCRCAACEQRRRRGPEAPQPDPAVRLVAIEPVGLHGLNLQFDDGHRRGIYPWALLRELASL